MLDYRTLLNVSYFYRFPQNPVYRQIAVQIPGGQSKSPGIFCGKGGDAGAKAFREAGQATWNKNDFNFILYLISCCVRKIYLLIGAR